MKKTLFFIMALALCTSLMAQDFRKPINVKHQAVPILNGAEVGVGTDAVSTIPTQRGSIVQNGPGYYLEWVGLTCYNLPSNSHARNTISFRPNSQDAALVWTTATDNDSRGTGINYYDMASRSWGGVMPGDIRVESVRTGWGGHAFTSQGEIVVSHNGLASDQAGIVVNTKDNFGDASWTEYVLKCSPYSMNTYESTGIQWPAIAANGNTVHLIVVTEQISQTDPCAELTFGYKIGDDFFSSAPLYYRSSDGGKTWDIKERNFLAEGMSVDEMKEVGGDSYSLAVRGDHVVFLYKFNGGLSYMESEDNGNSWVKKVILHDENFHGTPTVDLEPRLTPSTCAVFIDENHKVHVIFSGRPGRKQAGDCRFYIWGTMPGGYVYWNDTHGPIDWKDLAAVEDGGSMPMYDTAHTYPKYKYYIHNVSVLGFPNFYYWTGSPTVVSTQFRNNGFGLYPRIFVQDGRVFISYQSPLDFPLSVGEHLYRGIFVTVSEDGGETWDVDKNTSWVSYNPELFQANWDEWKEPIYHPGDDTWEWDPTSIIVTTRAENAHPTMSTNMKDWQILLQWLSQEKPFSLTDGIQPDPSLVYAFHHPLWKFPEFNRLPEVRKGLWNKIAETKPVINAKIYPNPAIDGIVNVKVDTDAPYTLTVTNIMGQVVYSTKAQNEAKVNVSS
ncbi:MAG: T9SS type A sorting domain-containing protein, partial [Lentimicrobiaceae bacterium]|nr:T9SS type A sorting domain-containing protein [Lentimicrobiaceae bacterium]